MDLSETEFLGVNWIHVAQDMRQWWAVENWVISFQVSKNAGSFLSG
jgi:hypothetical protein